MRQIRSKDMKPELTVRRLTHAMGYRYRLHYSSLPGKPDLVFPARKKIVEVRGCFWHQHKGCIDAHIPKSNVSYWRPKLERNKRRDQRNMQLWCKMGWKALIIWECEAENLALVALEIRHFLDR